METLDMIHARKAVRQYTGQVTDDQLHLVLAAGNEAPVGMGNYDDYRLTAIQQPTVLQQLQNAYQAPTVIVISVKDPQPMTYLSAGAIAHSMELTAEDLGLGANYNMASLPSIPTDVLPAGFTPVFAVTLGQTSASFVPRNVPADRIKTTIIK